MSSKNLLQAVLLGLLMALIFGSCKKDNVELVSFPDEGGASSQAGYRDPSSGAWHFTMEEVKQYFEEKQAEVAGGAFTMGSDTVRQAMVTAELLWEFADTVLYAGSVEVLMVPVKAPEPSQLALGKEAYFMFFKTQQDSLDARLMLILADEGYVAQAPVTYPEGFTGHLLLFNWKGRLDGAAAVEEGYITSLLFERDGVEFRDIECCDISYSELQVLICQGAEGCAVGAFFLDLYSCYTCSGSGSGNSVPAPPTAPPTVVTPTQNYWDLFGILDNGTESNTNAPGSSGLNHYYIGNFFDLTQFSGEQYLMAQAVNKFKETYGLAFSGPALWDMIQQNCSAQFGEVGPNPLVFLHQLDGFLSASVESMNECLQDIIEDNALRILSQGFGLNLDEQQLHDIFSMDCIYGGDFEACALEELVGWIGTIVILSEEEFNYLNSYSNALITSQIGDFILNNNLEFEQSTTDAVTIYIDLLANDTDFNVFAFQEFSAIPGWMWPIMREIGIEVAIELVKRYVPGVSE